MAIDNNQVRQIGINRKLLTYRIIILILSCFIILLGRVNLQIADYYQYFIY